MDNSRDHDLAALHARFNDHHISRSKRERAYRTFQKLQSQLKDRRLVGLRWRLIAAHRADDQVEIEKLEQLIKEYVWRNYGEVSHG